MRTIQRYTIKAYTGGSDPFQSKRITEIEILLPKDSLVLGAELQNRVYSIWFEGQTEECPIEKIRLAIFGPEDPIPMTTLRFHSRVQQLDTNTMLGTPALFLYEFRTP